MFSSNVNTSGIRSEYSSIATGNVTTTVDNLHTAQTQLQATQNALQQAADPGHQHQEQPPAVRVPGIDLEPTRTRPRWTASTPHPGPGGPAAAGRGRSRPSRRRPRHSTPGWPQAQAAQAAAAAAPSGGGGGSDSSGGGSAAAVPARPATPAGRRCRRCGAGGRERDRRPLRLGRQHAGRLRLLGSRAVVVRPGRHQPPRTSRGPSSTTPPTSRWPTSSPATCSSTGPAATSTWPCTSAAAR